MATKYLTIRCRAFASEGARTNKISVDANGTIRVYDSISGHYTCCHSLSVAAQRRIQRQAR